MALIGEIRKRSWVLIVLIGLGMGGFLLMDMTSQSQSIFSGGQNSVGSIDGQKVKIDRFQYREQAFYGNSGAEQTARVEAMWEYYVQERIVKQEAKKLGFNVSQGELDEMFNITSPQFSQLIAQYFGQGLTVDDYKQYHAALKNGQLSPDQVAGFRGLEERVELDRLGQKLSTIVSKGIYTPTWMAEMNHNDENLRIDFRFVQIPYGTIPDEGIKVSDSEIASYIKKHAKEYEQEEETRTIDYVVFDVIATSEDSAVFRNKLAGLATELEATQNDSSFILTNGGTIDVTYFEEDDLSAVIKDTISTIGVDSVFGPYVDGNQFKVLKVLDRKEIPDSVQARHVLLPIQNFSSPEQITAAHTLADSLLGLLNNGISFDSIALAHSQDPSSKNIGGDLGMKETGPQQYLKELNDLVFYTGKQNKVYKIQTQVGVHLVEITNQVYSGTRGYQIAYLSETIVPSASTENTANNKAFKFRANNKTLEKMKKSAEEDPTITVLSSNQLKRNDYRILNQFGLDDLQGSEEIRKMVKFAFKADKGEVAKDIFVFRDQVALYDNKYVIAAYSGKRSKGTAAVEDVREEVRQKVLNEKKAAKIISEITGTTLDEIAGQYNQTVQDAKSVNFNQAQAPGVGNEPVVIAEAMKLELNQVSKPIQGTSGVFVVESTYKPAPTPIADIQTARGNVSQQYRTQLQQSLFPALRKQAKIKDRRYNFY